MTSLADVPVIKNEINRYKNVHHDVSGSAEIIYTGLGKGY